MAGTEGGFQGRIVLCRRASVRPWFVRRLEDVNPPGAQARRILVTYASTASLAPRLRGSWSSSSSPRRRGNDQAVREVEPVLAEDLRVEAIELG